MVSLSSQTPLTLTLRITWVKSREALDVPLYDKDKNYNNDVIIGISFGGRVQSEPSNSPIPSSTNSKGPWDSTDLIISHDFPFELERGSEGDQEKESNGFHGLKYDFI